MFNKEFFLYNAFLGLFDQNYNPSYKDRDQPVALPNWSKVSYFQELEPGILSEYLTLQRLIFRGV